MRPLDDAADKEINDIFMNSLRYLDHYVNKYAGNDPKMDKRMKAAGAAVGACVRRLATEANRMAIEGATARVLGEAPQRKALAGGK